MSKLTCKEKEEFIKEYDIREQFIQAEIVDSNLWDNLQAIGESYDEYSKNSDAIAQGLLVEILKSDELKKIHSVRYRIKDKNSLKVKIVKKKSALINDVSKDYEVEKYRELNSDNYYKILTDLIGFRILIRYRPQWETVHKWIWSNFYQGDEHYINNHLNDYESHVDKPFIAEKPKVYYRNKTDLSFYEQMGRNFFEFIESDEGYNSIHYIINKDGKYIEIQVRTIFDEAWSECTHDIVYKNKDKSLRRELNSLSKCLSQQTIAAESIVNLLYDKVFNTDDSHGTIDAFMNISGLPKNNNDNMSNDAKTVAPKISNIKRRIQKINDTESEFDGDVGKLI